MPTFASDGMLGATALSASLGYIVPNSAYFTPNAYLSRVAGSNGSTRRWLFDGWVKLSLASGDQTIFGAWSGAGGGNDGIYYRGSQNQIGVFLDGGGTYFVTATPLLKDTTAWGHLRVEVDLDAADTVKIIWNRVQLATTGTKPGSGYSLAQFNKAGTYYIGYLANASYAPFSGYLSQTIVADGTIGSQDDTTELDVAGNVVPVNASGVTFGTNGGLYLFDNVAALGEDSSGNANDFTVNGTIVQTTDTPTDDAAAGIGNFATLNPLGQTVATGVTLSNGNLSFNITAGGPFAEGTISAATGKFSAEVSNIGGAGVSVGVCAPGIASRDAANSIRYTGYAGTKIINGTETAYGAAYGSGNRIRIELNLDDQEVEFFKDDVSQGVISLNGSPGDFWTFYATRDTLTGPTGTFNFGQTSLIDVPTSGFLPFCTANLPAPASAASVTPITGSFTGNAAADGPFVWLGYTPDTAGTCTINGNAITWGTHARATAGGMKIITISASYNASGSNTFSIAVLRPFGGDGVSQARAQ